MKVFVTGATGYIGTSVVEALQKAGHEVSGLSRSPENATKLKERGVRVYAGDLLRPETITEAARAADGVIHTANTNDASAGTVDLAVVRAILKSLEGTGKRFVYTSGVWVVGSTGSKVADENTPTNAPQLVAHRPGLEQEVLGYKNKGVVTSVIRPAVVYGRGGGGLLTMMIQSARDSGAARYVGTGDERWSLIHVDDLAQLYVLALEKAPAGSLYFAANGSSVPVRQLAEAASIAAGKQGKTEAWPLEEARKTLGAFADALVLDQLISSDKAKRELGWAPSGISAIADLKSGSYAQ